MKFLRQRALRNIANHDDILMGLQIGTVKIVPQSVVFPLPLGPLSLSLQH